MLIIGPLDTLEGSEKSVVDLFTNLPGAGVVAIGLEVPHRNKPSQQVDALLITPSDLTVIEIKGLRKNRPGVVHCPAAAAWTLVDETGKKWTDVVHTSGHVNPYKQIRQAVFGFKNLPAVGGRFVSGAVALGPHAGQRVTASVVPAPGHGLVIGVADSAAALRSMLFNNPSGRAVWDIDSVLAVLAATGLPGVDRSAIETAGFSDRVAPASTKKSPKAANPRLAKVSPTEIAGNEPDHPFAPNPFSKNGFGRVSIAPPPRAPLRPGMGRFRAPTSTIGVMACASTAIAILLLHLVSSVDAELSPPEDAPVLTSETGQQGPAVTHPPPTGQSPATCGALFTECGVSPPRPQGCWPFAPC